MFRRRSFNFFELAETHNNIAPLLKSIRLRPLLSNPDFGGQINLSIIRDLKTWEVVSPTGYIADYACVPHDWFELHFIQTGHCRLTLDDMIMEMNAGTAFLLRWSGKVTFEMSPNTRKVALAIPYARYASAAAMTARDPRDLLSGLVPVANVSENGLSVVLQMALILLGDLQEDFFPAKSPSTALLLKEALVTAFLQLWPSSARQEMRPFASGSVKRAIAWLHQHLTEDFTMQDLAKESGTNLRSLQLAFNMQMGIAPFAYIQRLRMQFAHRDLLDHNKGETVACIAQKWGFRHLGHFASKYRDAYGEYPSDTLHRRETKIGSIPS